MRTSLILRHLRQQLRMQAPEMLPKMLATV
jgi:hypothetical protein